MTIRKPSFGGKLIKKYWEKCKGKNYINALGSRKRGSGIYVLYDRKGKVYYIGISMRSLRRRIRKHWSQDRHKGKWEKYSFYQITRKKYIKDIETLLLRVYGRPRGNKVKGTLPSRYNLTKSTKKN